MAYKIIVSPRAQKEIEEAINFYSLYSVDAPVNFVSNLKAAYLILANNPFFRIRYKSVRAFKIRNFPYSLYFVINEKQQIVKVLSCFHDRRNPEKRPTSP